MTETTRKIQERLRGIVRRGDEISAKGASATPAETDELWRLVGEIDGLHMRMAGVPVEGNSFAEKREALARFPNPEIPDNPDDGDTEVRGGPLVTGKWGELCQRSGLSTDLGQWDSADEFFRVALSRRHDPRLNTRAMNTLVGDEGGFLLPGAITARVADLALEGELVRPRAKVYPITVGNSVRVPLWKDFDRSANGPAGITAKWAGESSSLDEQAPKVTMMTLTGKKLSFLTRISNEEVEDVPGFSESLIQALATATSFNLDSVFLNGLGTATPLGVLQSPARVTVTPESGQPAATIITENIDTMWSRLLPGSHKNAVWVANQTTIPALTRLSLAIGTAGTLVQALVGDGRGGYTLYGRPLVISEKVPVIGTEGDISLCDFSRYAIGLRADMRFDVSQHAAFSTDEMLVRLKLRIEGKPLDAKPIQPANGDPVSAFVTLGTRS